MKCVYTLATVLCFISKTSKAITGTPLTGLDQQEVLRAHNNERQRLVRGEVDGLPTAKEIPDLSWSTDLATLAAIEVARPDPSDPDDCYDDHHPERPENYGENLSWGYNADSSLQLLMNGWITEQHCWTYGANGAGQCDLTMCSSCGHYASTMINAVYTKVGCAVTSECGGFFKSKLACLYSNEGTRYSGPKPYECKVSGCPENSITVNEPSCLQVTGSSRAGQYTKASSSGPYGRSQWDRDGGYGAIFWWRGQWAISSSVRSFTQGVTVWCINNQLDPSQCEWSWSSTDVISCPGSRSSSVCAYGQNFNSDGRINGLWQAYDGGDDNVAFRKDGLYLWWGQSSNGYWVVSTVYGNYANSYLKDYCQAAYSDTSYTQCNWVNSGGAFTTRSCSGTIEEGEDGEEVEKVATQEESTKIAAWSWLMFMGGLLMCIGGASLMVYVKMSQRPKAHFQSVPDETNQETIEVEATINVRE